MNAESMPKVYNALLSMMAEMIGQRGRAPPCVNACLARKIRHAIAPVAWGKILGNLRDREANAPEQIRLVAIVRKKYAAVHDFAT
jgi:hypothetical protein